ncbi:MAG: TraR/DksA family transcriptional regulator [Candidatus Latescibacteria bacterium]|nr:TraR/DksA family transcriptional regulator [Candidatus Latescibacterota bacterium]
MDQEKLEFFKKLLLEKRLQVTEGLEEFDISRSENGREASEDRSAYSLHMADRGTDAMEREKSLLFAQRGGDYLDHVNEALERIRQGTFGVCRVCGGEVGHARLEAVPTATQCIACKSSGENRKP